MLHRHRPTETHVLRGYVVLKLVHPLEIRDVLKTERVAKRLRLELDMPIHHIDVRLITEKELKCEKKTSSKG